MTCPACGAANPGDARFCSQCGVAMASACPVCGSLRPPSARFCPMCGSPADGAPDVTEAAPLSERAGGEPEPEVTPVEERRIVSILFADLVGFTARSDQADPEDVRRTLQAFHARAKEDIERFGGVLDKFIGDAVMGVFGAPVAHGDDPERAVRAAFRVVQDIVEINREDPSLDLAVRVAVDTGEALVAFGHGPVAGERVAGDVVNTASRLQSVAPPGGVVVGQATYRATRDAIRYESLGAVEVKGKAEPVRVWLATEAIGQPGVEEEVAPSPFVGRTEELDLLAQLYARCEAASTGQMATVAGEPGIGKTRLVAALRQRLSALDRPPVWRVGRCLPYGDGIAFWPLVEVVKAEAGILETDGPGEAAHKLAAAVDRLEPDPAEREWLRARLAPVVGLVDPTGAAGPTVGRDESFAAWSRFVEAMAVRGPVVLVIEDLHWADPAMLDLIEHIANHVVGVPILVLCTTRPELFERRATWGGGRGNATTITLPRLSDTETSDLIAALLMDRSLSHETQSSLLEGAGGNPLFALEFVRMLQDRGGDRQVDLGASATRVAVPETVQALIAARLDALPAWQRSLVQDAAVVGATFWTGAVAAMSGLPSTRLDVALDELSARELISRNRGSAMEGETEFSFVHSLIREVAYRQIPRGGRALRHRAAGRWIERVAGERLSGRAELVAHHYTRALELLSASGGTEHVAELRDGARRSLGLAGDRAMSLDMAVAARHYTEALGLTPTGHPDRPSLLDRATLAGRRSGAMPLQEATDGLREAIEGYLALGEVRAAGETMVRLSFQLGIGGDAAGARDELVKATDLLEGQPPGSELALAYAGRAEDEMLAGDTEASLHWAEKSLDLVRASAEGSPAEPMALVVRGNARCEVGDLDGLDDFREVVRIAQSRGLAGNEAVAYNYLGEWTWLLEGPARGIAHHEQGIALADRRGIRRQAVWTKAESLWMLFDLGAWDRLLARVEEISQWERDHGETQAQVMAMTYQARVLLERGRIGDAAALVASFLPRARQAENLQVLVPSLAVAAQTAVGEGDQGRALELVDEFDRVTAGRNREYRDGQLPEVVRTVLAADGPGRAERLVGEIGMVKTRGQHCVVSARAALVENQGRHQEAANLAADAAARWGRFGFPLERGHALLVLGRSQRALGKVDEGRAALDEARSTFDGLGASPMVRAVDDALIPRARATESRRRPA